MNGYPLLALALLNLAQLHLFPAIFPLSLTFTVDNMKNTAAQCRTSAKAPSVTSAGFV